MTIKHLYDHKPSENLVVRKMAKSTNKTIVVPILNNEYKVIVCWGDSIYIHRVLRQWMYPNDFSSDMLAGRRGVCFHSAMCHPVIALPKQPQTAEEIGSLSHEAVHAVADIFRKIEQDFAEEVYAHSVGAIVRKVLENN